MVNTKTRLAEAYTCFSPCSAKLTDKGFSYTARGEVSDIFESTPHSAGYYYHVYETYWPNGAVDQLNGANGTLNLLPGLPTITYSVDGEGRPYSATASPSQTLLSSTSYNVSSLPTQVNLGSSDSDSFVYDPNTNRMTQYSYNVDGHSVVGNLMWNPLGTLASLGISDPFNPADVQTCSYVHDDLTRIGSTTANVPGVNCLNGLLQVVWSQIFTYDAFGNITKNGNSSFNATYSSGTNQMSSIGNNIPSYDLNGNVTNDWLNTYTWDANGRPVTADGVGLSYDALGDMVEQNRTGNYTQIAYSPDGRKLALMNGSTLQKGFVPLAGGSIAVYNSGGLSYYRHSDWVGSSRFASTENRAMYFDGAYAPFGEPYAQTGTTDLSFTGMNQDTAPTPTLYDFPAREYGIQGRWPSPDPAGTSSVDMTDPQSWNRYAYVRNSPLNLTDPLGLEEGGGGDCNLDPLGCGFDPCEFEPCVGSDQPSTIPPSIQGPTPNRTGFGATQPLLATGPGVDYSWLGLLRWALGLPDPCSPQFGLASPCVMANLTSITINGNSVMIGTSNGDVFPSCGSFSDDVTDYCTMGPDQYWNSSTGAWQYERPPMSPNQAFFANMDPEQKRIWDFSNQVGWLSTHPFDACEGADLVLFSQGAVMTPALAPPSKAAEWWIWGGVIGAGATGLVGCN